MYKAYTCKIYSQNPLILFKGLIFDQFMFKSIKKPQQNPINTPEKSEQKGGKWEK